MQQLKVKMLSVLYEKVIEHRVNQVVLGNLNLGMGLPVQNKRHLVKYLRMKVQENLQSNMINLAS